MKTSIDAGLDGIFDSVLRVAAWLDSWLYSES
jgi:hypothetical protein